MRFRSALHLQERRLKLGWNPQKRHVRKDENVSLLRVVCGEISNVTTETGRLAMWLEETASAPQKRGIFVFVSMAARKILGGFKLCMQNKRLGKI
jgi:hypothetical protein